MKRIAIFCGSSSGNDYQFVEQAKALGHKLAQDHIEIVYGGANIGLMGAVANAALDNSGKVIGVIPNFLRSKELAHHGLTELIEVGSMHERKTKMNDLCDGVIALPGGFGTLDELFEMLTWGQLGLHKKPIGILNTAVYYDALIEFLDHMTAKGLLKEENRKMLLVSDTIDDLITQMRNYEPPTVGKWISSKTS